ncbi:MAG: hypothetical protein JWR03_1083, partial [Cohnella sp.]|nr:hypothetical protein [Cohnella sp.]
QFPNVHILEPEFYGSHEIGVDEKKDFR